LTGDDDEPIFELQEAAEYVFALADSTASGRVEASGIASLLLETSDGAVLTLLEESLYRLEAHGALTMPTWLTWVQEQESRSAGGARLMLQKLSTALGGLTDLDRLSRRARRGQAPLKPEAAEASGGRSYAVVPELARCGAHRAHFYCPLQCVFLLLLYLYVQVGSPKGSTPFAHPRARGATREAPLLLHTAAPHVCAPRPLSLQGLRLSGRVR